MTLPVSHPQTPSQTIGPYFAIGLTASNVHKEHRGAVSNTIRGDGEVIEITGKVFDGHGEAVQDAMIEIFQADSNGRTDSTHFLGLARSETGGSDDHSFHFETIKPGALSEEEAPYIAVVVYLRGLLLQVYTRIYFSDEMVANSKDPVFSNLPVPRRDTLVAVRRSSDRALYSFDIHMQGENETLFFRV